MSAILSTLAFAATLAQTPVPARYVAGSPAVESGVRFVRAAPVDGDAKLETRAGKACLRTDAASNNAYVYFDVSRKWLRQAGWEPYRIELSVEYLDQGTDRLAVQYDAMGATVEANFSEVAWAKTNTGEWRTHTVVLDRAELRSAQHGQSDFRIAAGNDGDECVASVTVRVVAASREPAARPQARDPRMPRLDELSVALGGARIVQPTPANRAEAIALARFRERMQAIRAPGGAGPTIVVGRWRADMAGRYPRTARLVRKLAAERAAFRRRDGYVVCVERAGPRPVVCAVGLQSPGAVYAIGHLHARALRDGGRGVLRLDRAPALYAPALDRRELYLNTGYGLSRERITVDTWTAQEWRRYIDTLVLARYNTWSFYLWPDGAMLHPLARANAALNTRFHRRLREAIAYSHERGLRVGLQFTPSMLPVEVWDAHPDLRAKLEYHYPGTMCPSKPEVMRISRDVHGLELRWFRDVDFYSIWFYDVGGCFCDTCRAPERQLASLLEQTTTFADMAHAANPRAGFQVMAWGIWRYESKHGYTMREPFVDQVQRWFRQRGRTLEMADGIYVDPGTEPLFGTFRHRGLPAHGFLYQTNIETGQPFPIQQTRYLARWAPEVARAGARGAFLMRMEAGTKQVDDVVAGAYLWNPRADADRVVHHAARQVAGDTRAARWAWEALRRIDDFAWLGYARGGATPRQGRLIRQAALAAVNAAPRALRPGLEWLRGAGEGYRILGDAAEATDEEDEPRVAALNAEFTRVTRRSPLYGRQAVGAPYWEGLFRASLVRYFYSGWATYHF